MSQFKHFEITIRDYVAQVSFNRPHKANALHMEAWEEMQEIFERLDELDEVRVIILTGEGKHFCAGIDLDLLTGPNTYLDIKCEGRKREALRRSILKLQNSITALEKCRKPVIAAIHRACIGGAVDIVSACDMRYCTQDAYFAIKEIDLGFAADIGTLQRLPKIINSGIVAELAYTGRHVSGEEARDIGLATRLYKDQEDMMAEVTQIAKMIAAKSPLAIRSTKQMLLYSRDHSVPESLDYMASWNAGVLLSKDLAEAFQASAEKREPTFE
ncbi:MAG: crotonase/enoyl-CoA hydratase family protein [Saprospiraceae bacterium]|nr:crotonase/enoyl-CoA hydratase family protein [Saprospiraceae bacterium]